MRAGSTDDRPESRSLKESVAKGRQRIVVLGSTGSIGCSTLDVLADHPDEFEVYALAAHRNIKSLVLQCLQHRPAYAAIADQSLAADLQALLKEADCATEVLSGDIALQKLASESEVDTVVAGIVGAAGLPSTMSAVSAGKKVLLANKETLVIAGELFINSLENSAATLLPIDSEHNAIFQCLPDDSKTGHTDSHSIAVRGGRPGLRDLGVSKLLLTGSGGPFRTLAKEKLADVTPEQACAHPNWSMGQKISVDSATMMNKGLELIEACWLFNTEPAFIEIVIHPQSIVHSMVEFIDGSVMAQLGSPDMRTPIAHALAWPKRIRTRVATLDWSQMGGLEFEAPDEPKFPALRLAREVANTGGSAAVVLNAANEIAVEAFLGERIGFLDIVRTSQQSLEKFPSEEPESIEHIQELDKKARALAMQIVDGLS